VSDCTGQTTECTQVNWPGYRTTARHARSGSGPDIRTWFGGLVDGMRDASGQMYMRNRYYDRATGQFTQTDPIGLAGGLNAYGFAAGDPVTYSDPYGLSAQGDTTRRNQAQNGNTDNRYDRCEVATILNDLVTDLRNNPRSFFPRHPDKYDFRAEDEAAHGEDNLQNYYQVGDRWLRSDQFGNFAAGYAGQRAWGFAGYAAMRGGGILYATLHGEGNEDPLDLASAPMIHAGAQRAIQETGQNGHLANRMSRTVTPLTGTTGCPRN
jgi:RHS repeat-associated protein